MLFAKSQIAIWTLKRKIGFLTTEITNTHTLKWDKVIIKISITLYLVYWSHTRINIG